MNPTTLPTVPLSRLANSTETVVSLTEYATVAAPATLDDDDEWDTYSFHPTTVDHNTVFDLTTHTFFRVEWATEGESERPTVTPAPATEYTPFPFQEPSDNITDSILTLSTGCVYNGSLFIFGDVTGDGTTRDQTYLYEYKLDEGTWVKHLGPFGLIEESTKLVGFHDILYLFQSSKEGDTVTVGTFSLAPVQYRRWEKVAWEFEGERGDEFRKHHPYPFVLNDTLHLVLTGIYDTERRFHLVLRGN
ncbi:hypothetical protein KIPB_009041, partial [Kipferlia bialata]|eukprot:g9041.t1